MYGHTISAIEFLTINYRSNLPYVVIGVFFKRIGLINDNFIEVASKLVFQVTLPTMLFLSIVVSEHDFSAASRFLGFAAIANIAFFIFTTLSVNLLFKTSPIKVSLLKADIAPTLVSLV